MNNTDKNLQSYINKINAILTTNKIANELERRQLYNEALELFQTIIEIKPDIIIWGKENCTIDEIKTHILTTISNIKSTENLENKSTPILQDLEKLTEEERVYTLQKIIDAYRNNSPFEEFIDEIYTDGFSEGETSDYAFDYCATIVKNNIDEILDEISDYDGTLNDWLNSEEAKNHCHEYRNRIEKVKNLVEEDIKKFNEDLKEINNLIKELDVCSETNLVDYENKLDVILEKIKSLKTKNNKEELDVLEHLVLQSKELIV